MALNTRLSSLATRIKTKFNAMHGGASGNGNTLKKLEDRILGLENRVAILEGGNPNLPKFSNLLAWWKLDETSGTRVNSKNPGTLDLTLLGTNSSVVGGKIGNGLTGISTAFQGLYAANPASLTIAQNFSLSCWLYITQFDEQILIFNEFDSNSFTHRFLFEFVAVPFDSFFIDIDGGATNIQFQSTPVPRDTWNHIVLTHDVVTKAFTLYLNGTQYDSTQQYIDTVSVHPFDLYIGSNLNSFPNDCIHDEIAFWDTILDANDVATLWNSGNGMTY